MTFRKKTILVLVLAAALPVSVAGTLVIRGYQEEMTEKIDSFHNRIAALAASGIEDFLSDTLRSLMLSTSIIPWEQFPASDLPDAVRIPYRQFDYINIVGLYDQNGVQRATPAFERNPEDIKGLEGHEPVELPEIEVFTDHIPFSDALSNGYAFGPAYYSTRVSTPRVALAIAFPVRNGREKWLLAAEISLRSLVDKIRSITPSTRGMAFIVDSAGRVVAHSEQEMMVNGPSLNDLDILLNGRKADRTTTERYLSQDGTEMAGAYSSIPIAEWGLVVAQPVDEAFAAVNRMRTITLFWLALGLGVAVAGGIVLARGVTAPVRELAKGAERIGGGNFMHRIPIHTNDEIGRLAETFNRMSAELKQSFDTISEKNEEIAAWNEELKARVKARTRELRQAEEQIIQSQKTAVVTEMSAGIAHQINNPLTSILGFSQFLLTQQTDEGKLRHYLSLIEKGAKRIESLVEELLKFSRQYDNPSFTDIDLNLLIGNTLKVVDRQLKEKRITTQTRFADDLPLATGDPVELQQAVMHLVNNARSAMPEGGELAVGTETVDGGAIKVSIEDSGKGIPEEDLSKVFDLFYTTQNGEETSKRGLGLSVVDRIIRDHKGRISVTSKQGKGSTFTIYLPGLQKTTHLR